MISVKHLDKYYNKGKRNELHVINDTSIEFPETGLITLLGPSGCGKTTLLNVIGGLDKASGEILYDNEKDVEKYRRENIGYIFQSYNLLNDFTVYDNLAIALSINNIEDKNEVDKRIESALKAVGMFKYRKKLTSELSGGQQQRVSIARALVKKTKVIIADEPTGNLDSANSIQIMKILKALSKTKLVLLVTHSKELANYYSDKIIDIKDGKILEIRDSVKDSNALKAKENKVRLYELEKTELNNEDVDVTIYQPQKEKVELELICVNNTYYLKSNVKIVPFSNQIQIEETKELEEENKYEEEDINYSDEDFKDSIHINFFERFKTAFKESFGKRQGVKRKKIFKLLFFTLGFILAILNLNLARANFIETSDMCDAGDKVLLTDKSGYYSSSLVKDSYKNGLSETFMPLAESDLTLKLYKGSYTFDSYNVNALYTEGHDLMKGEIIYGDTDDLVMSKKIADELIKKSGLSDYETLIKKLNTTYYAGKFSSNNHKFSGIVDEDNDLIYEDVPTRSRNEFYTSFSTLGVKYNDQNYTARNTYEVDSINHLNESNLLYGKKELNNKEVVISKGFFEAFNLDISSSYKDCTLYIDEELNCTIVGVTNEEDPIIYTTNNDYRYILVDKNLSLYESKFTKDYSYGFYLLDNTNKLDSLKKDGYKSYTYYNYLYKVAKEGNKSNANSYIPFIAICTVILVVYIFFIMRTQIIKDVYELGVLRALGLSKIRIYLNYTLQIIITVFETVFTAFLIFTVLFGVVNLKIASYTESSFNLFTQGSTYYVFFIMLILTIVVGLIPVMLIVKKKPAEILAKYDM